MHRAGMTGMLGMVKKEMSMVNLTDADRDNLEVYIEELGAIQAKKAEVLGEVRKALKRYKAAAAAARKAKGGGGRRGSGGLKLEAR